MTERKKELKSGNTVWTEAFPNVNHNKLRVIQLLRAHLVQITKSLCKIKRIKLLSNTWPGGPQGCYLAFEDNFKYTYWLFYLLKGIEIKRNKFINSIQFSDNEVIIAAPNEIYKCCGIMTKVYNCQISKPKTKTLAIKSKV